MTPFSVYTQDDESPPGVTDTQDSAPEEWMPEVLLRLPAINAEEDSLILVPSAFRDRLFWALIGFGVLLALGLIVTGKKAPTQPLDEAPTWHDADGKATGTPDVSPLPSFESNSSTTDVSPRMPDIYEGPALGDARPADVYQDPQNSPAVVGTSGPVPHTEQAERVRDTRWDGNAPAASPGQAAPLGNIITTPAQP